MEVGQGEEKNWLLDAQVDIFGGKVYLGTCHSTADRDLLGIVI